MGVKAITLNEGDKLVAMDLIKEENDLLVITENGYGKRTPITEYRAQSRGGKGIKTYNVKKRTGNIIGAKVVSINDEVMLISVSGTIIRLKVSDISQMGRSTQGVTLMKISENDRVVSIAKVAAEEDDDE